MNQVLEQRYIDKQRLFSLLTKLFPNGDFTVEVRDIKCRGATALKKNLAGHRRALCYDFTEMSHPGKRSHKRRC